MGAAVRFFAINADDDRRAKDFYNRLFGWRYRAFGPPGFSLIETPRGPVGAIQERDELVEGRRTRGFLCTLAVGDIAEALAAAEAAGGRVLTTPHFLERVGEIAYLEDPEGNVVGVGQYLDAERTWTADAPMHGVARHFAINVEDGRRARSFYERVFGWSFVPAGPPGFYLAPGVGDGRQGALQDRRDLTPGVKPHAFEVTVEVDDIDAAVARAMAAGGKVLETPYRIEGVGEIGYIEDTEGNLCGLAQVAPGYWR